MQILVNVYDADPKPLATYKGQGIMTLVVHLKDKIGPDKVAELEQDLMNTLNLLVNTWGLS